MSDTTTIVRLLRFISLLSSPTRRTAKEYAGLFEVNKSTISRYRTTLEEVGFSIHKDRQHHLYIDKANPQLLGQLHFDEEETQLLTSLLRASGSARQKDLLNKIYIHSPLPQLAASAAEAQLARFNRLLMEAMRKEQQVMLMGYTSMNGSDKRDRKVEPIRFIRNDQLIEAFEVESQTTKHFQLDRMADIRRLQVPFQHKARHQSKVTDPFYIADVAQTEIILEMSLRAGQRMKEDYKDTLPYLQEGLENFVYRGPVNAQFINLDRWLMGWCDEVHILKPDSLKTHLEKLWTEKKL